MTTNGDLGGALRGGPGAVGIYLHVPFCRGKCPYCDFYSLRGDGELMDRYVSAMGAAMDRWAGEHGGAYVQTVYFGGGTPSLLGAGRLAALLGHAKRSFGLAPAAEVTLEANPSPLGEPSGEGPEFFRALRQAGFNRLSLGLQSADEDQLRFLGRRHSPLDAARAVEAARAGGFGNISLDLMLGLPHAPGETPEIAREKLGHSVRFAGGLGVEHLSAYLLKVEEGTPFALRGVEPLEEDEAADQYLFLVEELQKQGYRQYEISNFSRPGWESRHNLIYWHGEEYLGFGPGAHSFYGGKRFFYPRDLAGFLQGAAPVEDGEGGSFPEYAMLNLRLAEGLRRQGCRRRYGEAGEAAFERVLGRAKKCPPGLVRAGGDAVFFTPEGFLVSNALTVKLLGEE